MSTSVKSATDLSSPRKLRIFLAKSNGAHPNLYYLAKASLQKLPFVEIIEWQKDTKIQWEYIDELVVVQDHHQFYGDCVKIGKGIDTFINDFTKHNVIGCIRFVKECFYDNAVNLIAVTAVEVARILCSSSWNEYATVRLEKFSDNPPIKLPTITGINEDVLSQIPGAFTKERKKFCNATVDYAEILRYKHLCVRGHYEVIDKMRNIIEERNILSKNDFHTVMEDILSPAFELPNVLEPPVELSNFHIAETDGIIDEFLAESKKKIDLDDAGIGWVAKMEKKFMAKFKKESEDFLSDTFLDATRRQGRSEFIKRFGNSKK